MYRIYLALHYYEFQNWIETMELLHNTDYLKLQRFGLTEFIV